MKPLLLLALATCLWAGYPAYVTENTGNGTSSPVAVTITSAAASVVLWVDVAIKTSLTRTVSSISCSNTTGWTLVKAVNPGTGWDVETWVGYATSASGTSLSVTLSASISGNVAVHVTQYSGAQIPPVLDGTAIGNNGSSTAPTAGVYSTAGFNTRPIVMEAHQTGTAPSGQPSGYTALTWSASSTVVGVQADYLTTPAGPGAQSATWTIGSASWVVIIAGLEGAPPVIASNGSGGGNWSTTGTWAGGVVPGSTAAAWIKSGDTVTITGNVTVGQITVLGSLKTDGAAAHTLSIVSTGSSWQTNMWGIVLCPNGVLDWSAATLANYMTFGSSSANPVAIFGENGASYGCSGYGDQTIKINYTVFTSACGTSVGPTACVYANNNYGSNPGVVITNSVFNGSYQPLLAYGRGTAHVFDNNYITGVGCAASNGAAVSDSSGNTGTIDMSYNTLVSPAGNCLLYYGLYLPSGAQTYLSDAVFDTASYQTGIAYLGAGTLAAAITASYPIIGSVNTTSHCASFAATGTATYYVSVDHAICDGATSMQINSGGAYERVSFSRFVTGITNNTWQGSTIENLGSSNVLSSYNSSVMLGNNAGNQCNLTIDGPTGSVINHDTCIMSLPDSQTSVGVEPGEGTTAPLAATSFTLENVLITGTTWGTINENPYNTFSTNCAWGGGLCNNDIPPALISCPMLWGCGSTTCAAGTLPTSCGNTLPYNPTTATGGHWDNGTTPHPNSIYGDQSINPVFADPFRTLAGYDKYLGQPGALANVASCLGLLNTPLAAVIGVSCTGTPANYAPALLWNWMDRGVKPLQVSLATGASDGTQFGATQPVCLVGCIQ